MKSKSEKSFVNKMQTRFDKKQNEMQRYPATFGDAMGNVIVSGLANFNYCTIGGRVLPVFNNRIPAKSGVAIWVGYDSVDTTDDKKPKKFQVLSTRSEDPSNGQGAQLGYAPGNYYRYMARNGGGVSPLFLEKRAWLPLRISPTSPLSMSVHLYEGAIWTGSEFLYIAPSDIDLTAHIPATAGKAAYVLLTISNTGTVVQTKGSEVDIDVLTPAGDEFANIPAVPANTIEVLIPVRVYNGQTVIREARVNSDFSMDLRNVWHLAYLTSANIEDSIVDGHTTIAPSGNAVFDALAGKESTTNKDATSGYAGLTLFKINFKNVANTFTSYFTNSNTVARTYIFPNRDMTVAGTDDIINPPTTTAVNDFQVGDGAGAWIKKTLAETIIILRTVLDTTYSPILHGSHIPTGGATTQLLQWLSSGAAKWITASGDATIADGGAIAVNKTRLNVRNETGTTIATTTAVYVSGFNNLPLITPANNTVELAHNVIGVTVGSIAHQADGYIATGGQCDAETNAWTVGTELYLSSTGALTSTAPTSGSVVHVGIVTVQQNYPVGKLLIYHFPEENYLAGGTGVDTIIRMGDSAGANKVSFRDYANAEVGSINSDGVLVAATVNGLSAANAATLTSAGNADALHTHGFGARVYHNATQSLTNGITTTLAFNSERWDTDVCHDNTTNNERLTCKTAGKYIAIAHITFDTNATGERIVWIRASTTISILGQLRFGSGNGASYGGLTIVTIADLAVNDYLYVQGTQSSGGALNVLAGSSTVAYACDFMMWKIG